MTRRAIFKDIVEFGLDPKVAHKSDDSGRLKRRDHVEHKAQHSKSEKKEKEDKHVNKLPESSVEPETIEQEKQLDTHTVVEELTQSEPETVDEETEVKAVKEPAKKKKTK